MPIAKTPIRYVKYPKLNQAPAKGAFEALYDIRKDSR